MRYLLVNWVLTALGFLAVAHLVTGFRVSGLGPALIGRTRLRARELDHRPAPEARHPAAHLDHLWTLPAGNQRADVVARLRAGAGLRGHRVRASIAGCNPARCTEHDRPTRALSLSTTEASARSAGRARVSRECTR